MPILQTLLKPRALKTGDSIAVISPAGATVDPPDAFEKGIALLEAEGFRVKLMPYARNKRAYLAGTDAERLSDLHAAFQDPDVQGILCARGGYGALRIVSDIDFSIIRENPKVFIGFSDITVLHQAFYQEAGLVGFYGPMLTSNLIDNEPYSQAELLRLVKGEAAVPFNVPNQDTYTCFTPGIAEGPLMGGNLSLLQAMCGTRFHPKTEGAILFVEDWHERYYSLDRQFHQLKLAGLLDGIAGLLLCDFSGLTPDSEQPTEAFMRWLMADLTRGLNIPVGYGFSVGHGEQTATLPIGVRARFNATEGTLHLLESPVL